MSDVDIVRKTLDKAFGTDVTYLMSAVSSVTEDPISIGNVAFDHGLLGIGGLPRGHFVELSGDPKTGKTTLLLHMLAGCQNAGVVPLVIDAKGAVTTDVPRAERIGVDPDGVIMVPISSSDEALQKVRKAMQKLKAEDVPLAFFWDDMGLTPDDAELDPNQDKKTGRDSVKVASKSKSMWRFCRSLTGECYKSGASMVVVNQIQAMINTGFGSQYKPKETTSSGGGLRYTARIRIMLKCGQKIKKGTRNIGQIVYANTVANAFFVPFRSVQLYLDFRNGYSDRLSTLLNAEQAKIVDRVRGKYRVKGSPRGAKYIAFEDFDEEAIWALESKLWPWMDEDFAAQEAANDIDEDEEEENEDEFAEGYLGS